MTYVLLILVIGFNLINYRRIKRLMATLADVTSGLATLSNDVDAKFAAITAQVSAIEAGVPVGGATAADLEVLVGTIATINSKVNAFALPVV